MSHAARPLVSAVFPTLSAPALDRLLAAMVRLDLPPHETVCQQGEVETRFYLIARGSVDAFKFVEGQRLHLNHLAAGAHFGEIALLLDQPRSATIVTAEPTELLALDRALLAEFVRTDAEIVLALSRLVIGRFLLQEEKHLTEIARLKKNSATPPRVFVSYARPDEAFVLRLVNRLLRDGIDVWLDRYRLEPGRSWARQIGEALDRSAIMLLVFSPAALASENVDDEWNYFLDQRKPVVCALHQPCKLPYRLAKRQYVDFHSVDFDHAAARLAATLNTVLVTGSRAPVPGPDEPVAPVT